MRRRLALVALIAVAAGGVTACGGSEGAEPATADATRSTGESMSTAEPTDSETEPAEEPPADEAPTTLSRERFCGDFDAQGAADALGIELSRLVLGADRVPGEKYVPFAGQPKQTSTSWNCFHRTETGDPNAAVALVMEEKPATARDVSGAQDDTEEAYGQGQKAECTREPDPSWPEGGRLACSRPELKKDGYQNGYAMVSYRGLFGDVDFRCFVQLGPEPDLAPALSAAETICTDALALVGS